MGLDFSRLGLVLRFSRTLAGLMSRLMTVEARAVRKIDLLLFGISGAEGSVLTLDIYSIDLHGHRIKNRRLLLICEWSGCTERISVSILNTVKAFGDLLDHGQVLTVNRMASKMLLKLGLQTIQERLDGFSFIDIVDFCTEGLEFGDILGDGTALFELP